MKQGCLHLYYGDGKGKTTAAVGLCMRACGAGLRCGFLQFLKGRPTAERPPLETLGVWVLAPATGPRFWFEMDEAEKQVCRNVSAAALQEAAARMADLDLLVLDEVLDAEELGILPAGLLQEIVQKRPEALELVLTGHSCPEQLAASADYITRFLAEKHPYDKGLDARRGIEY